MPKTMTTVGLIHSERPRIHNSIKLRQPAAITPPTAATIAKGVFSSLAVPSPVRTVPKLGTTPTSSPTHRQIPPMSKLDSHGIDMVLRRVRIYLYRPLLEFFFE